MKIVDTNIISYAVKGVESAITWLADQDFNKLYISSITIFEIDYGCAIMPEGKRKIELTKGMKEIINEFGSNIINIDYDILHVCAQIISDARKRGKQISLPDGLIASTARIYNFEVISRDTDPYTEAKVKFYNPILKDE